MPKVVRKIHSPSSMVRDEGPEGSVLAADALKGFNTSQNRLSVYELLEDGVPEERLVAAISANAERLDRVVYAVFDEEISQEIGIKQERCLGETPDNEANAQHIDYVVGTAWRLFELVDAVSLRGDIRILNQKSVSKVVADAVRKELIELSDLSEKIQNQIRPLLDEEK